MHADAANNCRTALLDLASDCFYTVDGNYNHTEPGLLVCYIPLAAETHLLRANVAHCSGELPEAVLLRRKYAVMKDAARARRRRPGDARCLGAPPTSPSTATETGRKEKHT